MEHNRETILDELNDFEKRSGDISPVLEDYLLRIAKNGDIMFPWAKLKPLIHKKAEVVLNDSYETCPTDNLPPLPNVEPFKFHILKSKILEALDSFHSAPFTIQRICELLTTPRKHYKRTDKYMRGLEKNVLVVSTIEPKSRYDREMNNNSSAMMNGLISVGTNDQIPKKGNCSPNILPEIKLSNSGPQFDTFNILSTSTSIIINELPSTSQLEKTETDEHDANSNISDSNTNANEMDGNTFKVTNFSEENHCNQKIIHHKGSTITSDVSAVLNNSNHASLDNFSIFTSSVGMSDVSMQQNKKCEDSNDSFKTVINGCQMDSNTFPDNCDTDLPENAMEVTPSEVDEMSAAYERSDENTSSHSPLQDNIEYPSEIHCQSAQERNSVYSTVISEPYPNSPSDEIDEAVATSHGEACSVIAIAESQSYKECSGVPNSELPCVTDRISESSDLAVKVTSPFDVPNTHIMQRDSVVAICVESIVASNASKLQTGGMPDHNIMDLESPSKNNLPSFVHTSHHSAANISADEMEQD